jgi:stress-induced-phosphoprotein 1
MQQGEVEEEEEEYKQHANALKDSGNDAFQAGNIQLAVQLFSQAIDLDPDNYVFYSNRSAAYMKADSISKALWDAEKCIELAPNWSKGYNRLGVAQQGLKRFDAAIDTFKKGFISYVGTLSFK